MTDTVEQDEELDYTYPLGQPPTPLQARMGEWLMSEAVGYDPNAAKSKREAFLEGVRLCIALRIPYQASDHNKEATAQERADREQARAEAAAERERKRAERAAAAAKTPEPEPVAEQPATAKPAKRAGKPAKATTAAPAAPAAAPAATRPAARRAAPRRAPAAAATSGDAPF